MNLLLGLGSKAKMTLMPFTAIKVLVRNFDSGIVSNIQGDSHVLFFYAQEIFLSKFKFRNKRGSRSKYVGST